MPVRTQRDEAIAAEIRATAGDKGVAETVLETDERVLARITDGIYRQPASALRELISNAFDADANQVSIITDRPRFDRIRIEDDGHGMTPETLVHMLHHIGGSAKRSAIGSELGVASVSDPTRSPRGRRLIGKIGIGLFSISQLCEVFRIITKTEGDHYRTIAVVTLKPYNELPTGGDDEKFEAGSVAIWQEEVTDVASHGTSIVLEKIKPKTRDALRSAGDWKRFDSEGSEPFQFHIGRQLDGSKDELQAINGEFEDLPWARSDSPAEAFEALVDCVWSQWRAGERNPRLDVLFDSYLQMIWTLSLSVPLDYVDVHPLDLIPDNNNILAYELPGDAPGPARSLPGDRSIRDSLSLGPDTNDDAAFEVFIDDLQLSRPLRFHDLPSTSNAVKTPMLFGAHVRDEFAGWDDEMSGGPLDFQAYLLWAPKIVPVEHLGVLIRIHGASGMLFERHFMHYQVAETTRLSQISCEIFVSQGLEAALNIDRESVNYSHPHVVRLTSWLHAALTRVMNAQKQVASSKRGAARRQASDEHDRALQAIVKKAWARAARSVDDIPEVVLADSIQSVDDSIEGDSYVFRRAKVLGDDAFSSARRVTTVERQLAAILQVLTAYGAMEALDRDVQEELLTVVSEILRTADQ